MKDFATITLKEGANDALSMSKILTKELFEDLYNEGKGITDCARVFNNSVEFVVMLNNKARSREDVKFTFCTGNCSQKEFKINTFLPAYYRTLLETKLDAMTSLREDLEEEMGSRREDNLTMVHPSSARESCLQTQGSCVVTHKVLYFPRDLKLLTL